MFPTITELGPWVRGNLPVWTLLILVLGWVTLQVLRNRPILNQQSINERLSIKTGYITRIKELEAAVRLCQQTCEEDKRVLTAKCELLQERLNNEAMQRVQGEISLVSTLIKIVDGPELRQILSALEDRQIRLTQVHILDATKGAADEH